MKHSARVLYPALAVAGGLVLVVIARQPGADAGAFFPEPPPATTSNQEYRSPYSVKFTLPEKSLFGDLDREGRGDPEKESTVPFRDWYSEKVRDRFGVWGPPARHYPAPPDLAKQSITWKRERVIAVALRLRGYGYQHHHIPDWDPPEDWPWKETAVGRNGKGVDCSNFTSFAYNLALGIKPNSEVKKQSEETAFAGPGEGQTTRLERIALPGTYAELVKTLQTGDLLYIRKKLDGEVSHVVLWVGPIGKSPDETPLVLDSHGEGVEDANKISIPYGVQLRPFRERSWYFHAASHALRVLR